MTPDRPPESRLARILHEHPEARGRLKRAVGGLLWVVLASVVAIAVLGVWHLRRRADLIRARLGTVRGGALTDHSPSEAESNQGSPE
ncbi:hypothetical protein [Paludisphaera rhizosphaerae]|uniref:hypothetical protein n=1 Tax=Paludisphaera rhizosphaerae TaxID=2711216 RepID=UPI00197FD9E9|nr:hypothetical protein [Paludisphaera rhizosphaerae]